MEDYEVEEKCVTEALITCDRTSPLYGKELFSDCNIIFRDGTNMPAHKVFIYSIPPLQSLQTEYSSLTVNVISKEAFILVLKYAYGYSIGRKPKVSCDRLLDVIQEVHVWGHIELAKYLWHIINLLRFGDLSPDTRTRTITTAYRFNLDIHSGRRDFSSECVKLMDAQEFILVFNSLKKRLFRGTMKESVNTLLKKAKTVWLTHNAKRVRKENWDLVKDLCEE